MDSDVDAGLDRDLACPIPFCDAARWRRPPNEAGAWNGVAMGSMAAAMAHPARDFAAMVPGFFLFVTFSLRLESENSSLSKQKLGVFCFESIYSRFGGL
jgi:hypothetical protein